MSPETNPLLAQQRRTNSTTGGVEPRPQEEETEEYEYEDFELNKPLKYTLIGGASFLCLVVLYVFTIYLPNHFIPQAADLRDIVKIDDTNVELIPINAPKGRSFFSVMKDKASKKSKAKPVDRIIMVGDIHGHFKEFEGLMKKIRFDHKRDHLLVLGDFITKGPDSMKVLEYLIDKKVDCILGNHEYSLLEDYAKFHNLDFPDIVNTVKDVTTKANGKHDAFKVEGGFNDDPEFLLAKKLQPKHIKYVNRCSLIKKLGDVPMYNKKIGKQIFDGISTETTRTGYAVHAGLRWDLDLVDQIPEEILTMRSLIPPFFNETTEDPHLVPGSISWAKHWNTYQKLLPKKESSIVYYGHDARKGLRLRNYAKGLDSGCDRGDDLLAMILWTEMTGPTLTYHEKVVQVSCDDDNDN